MGRRGGRGCATGRRRAKSGFARRTTEVLGARRRVLGEEHPLTLMSAGILAGSLRDLGKHAEAERINREVLDVSRRVLGEEHPDALTSANNLAMSLAYQRKHA